MKDWKLIAKASGMSLAGKELDQVAQALETLEKDFSPLVKDLAPDLEPALEFRAETDSQ